MPIPPTLILSPPTRSSQHPYVSGHEVVDKRIPTALGSSPPGRVAGDTCPAAYPTQCQLSCSLPNSVPAVILDHPLLGCCECAETGRTITPHLLCLKSGRGMLRKQSYLRSARYHEASAAWGIVQSQAQLLTLRRRATLARPTWRDIGMGILP